MPGKKILVAPLNWGLGHATRCIPVINELIRQNFEPVLASDGAALKLLQNEFPQLKIFSLPSYNIKYAKKGSFLRWKLLLQTPHILKTISAEKKAVDEILREEGISGVISDNRWGVRSSAVPSVFITHQVRVLSGFTTFFSSRIQQYYIRKFDECWIPDVKEEPSLGGRMSHLEKFKFKVKYLGILSRFEKQKHPGDIKVAAVLSGPEPQRSLLEKILLKELQKIPEKVVLVRGVVEEKKTVITTKNISIYNFLPSKELEKFLNSSQIIICRSGYTSLMDLAKLEKKAFFIPTPGQYEQEYLAKRLQETNFSPSCHQDQFNIEKLEEIMYYKGLRGFRTSNGLSAAFALFKGE